MPDQANPDPDGPPISAIVWPNTPIIHRQSPPGGSVLYRNDSLRVWLGLDLEPDMARKYDAPPPSPDRAHAVPDKPVKRVELGGDNPGPDGSDDD